MGQMTLRARYRQLPIQFQVVLETSPGNPPLEYAHGGVPSSVSSWRHWNVGCGSVSLSQDSK